MSERLSVDPIQCDGRGLCAELVPELVQLDEWGFPIISDAPVVGSIQTEVRRAIAMCPTLALRLLPRA